MLSHILRWFGYVSIDYGFSCGRHWVEIDGKMIAQTPGDALWMNDKDVRRLAIAVIEGCEWEAQEGDQWYIREVKKRWPWHDLEARVATLAIARNDSSNV